MMQVYSRNENLKKKEKGVRIKCAKEVPVGFLTEYDIEFDQGIYFNFEKGSVTKADPSWILYKRLLEGNETILECQETKYKPKPLKIDAPIPREQQIQLLNNVSQVYCNDVGYCCLKNDDSIVTFTHLPQKGGIEIQIGVDGVVRPVASNSNGIYAKINENFKLTHEQTQNVHKIFAIYDSFLALKKDGSIIIWGGLLNQKKEKNIFHISRVVQNEKFLQHGIKNICSNFGAFCITNNENKTKFIGYDAYVPYLANEIGIKIHPKKLKLLNEKKEIYENLNLVNQSLIDLTGEEKWFQAKKREELKKNKIYSTWEQSEKKETVFEIWTRGVSLWFSQCELPKSGKKIKKKIKNVFSSMVLNTED